MKMTDGLDLTFLTPQERSHLLSVVQRAKKVDEVYNRSPKHGNDREVTPDDIIRKKWKENLRNEPEKTSYVPAVDALSEALNGEIPTVNVNQDPSKRDTIPPRFPHSHQPMETTDDDTSSSSCMSSPRRSSCWRDSSDSTSSDSMVINRSKSLTRPGLIRVYQSPSKEDVMDDKNQLSPRSAQRRYSDTMPRRWSVDTRSMHSRSTLPSRDQIGTIDISLTYLPPNAVRQKTFPSKGTRFPKNKHLDVLTRKAYAIRSGAKISITKDRKSGAKMDEDGELCVFVKGANDLNLPTSLRQKAKTYVKCYLLPDRFHGSKMKSEIQKDTCNPKYNHRFVFRGFTAEEFNERSIEIVIGGVTSSRGRHPVVGGIRLSNGVEDASNPVAWKNPSTDESSLWLKAFESPSTEASATITLHPKIKLTYK